MDKRRHETFFFRNYFNAEYVITFHPAHGSSSQLGGVCPVAKIKKWPLRKDEWNRSQKVNRPRARLPHSFTKSVIRSLPLFDCSLVQVICFATLIRLTKLIVPLESVCIGKSEMCSIVVVVE